MQVKLRGIFAYPRKGTEVYERATFERHCVGFMYVIFLENHHSNPVKYVYFPHLFSIIKPRLRMIKMYAQDHLAREEPGVGFELLLPQGAGE